VAARLGTGRKLVFATVAIVLGFGLLELGARLLEIGRPPLAVDYGLGFGSASRVYVAAADDPSMRVTRESKLQFFLPERFSAQKPAGVLRIVALGGSSVRFGDSELQTMVQRLTTRMERSPSSIELINAGALGYGSHRLVPILDELLQYEPDLVLIYSGHNEFEEVEQLILSERGAVALERRLAHSAFFRLLRDTLTSARVRVMERDHNQRVLSRGPPQARAWNHPFTQQDVDERMVAYRRNLERMILRCQAAGVPLVIGTVPSNLYRPVLRPDPERPFRPIFDLYQSGDYELGLSRARIHLRETIARHQSSDHENEIIRDLAQRHGVPLADVEARIVQSEPNGVPGETLFKDHCHLNARGNRIWRQVYETIVYELIK
jgi:lysophospholipase L1-like esterase